jgi:hypothetical protein
LSYGGHNVGLNELKAARKEINRIANGGALNTEPEGFNSQVVAEVLAVVGSELGENSLSDIEQASLPESSSFEEEPIFNLSPSGMVINLVNNGVPLNKITFSKENQQFLEKNENRFIEALLGLIIILNDKNKQANEIPDQKADFTFKQVFNNSEDNTVDETTTKPIVATILTDQEDSALPESVLLQMSREQSASQDASTEHTLDAIEDGIITDNQKKELGAEGQQQDLTQDPNI